MGANHEGLFFNQRLCFLLTGTGVKAHTNAKRLKQLEAENARLKKLVVERDLEIEVMKEIVAKKW